MSDTAHVSESAATPTATAAVGGFLLHRWPTAVALALAGLSLADGVSRTGAAIATLMGALAYLVAAAVDWRRAAWIVVPAGFVAVVALRLLEIDPLIGSVVVGAGFFAWGAWRGRLRTAYPLLVCGIALTGFAAVSIGGVRMASEIGLYLVAAALLGHGIWDVIHHWANRVVDRSLAEFCLVLDFVLGFAVLAAALT
jgi:hypothetical protein